MWCIGVGKKIHHCKYINISGYLLLWYDISITKLNINILLWWWVTLSEQTAKMKDRAKPPAKHSKAKGRKDFGFTTLPGRKKKRPPQDQCCVQAVSWTDKINTELQTADIATNSRTCHPKFLIVSRGSYRFPPLVVHQSYGRTGGRAQPRRHNHTDNRLHVCSQEEHHRSPAVPLLRAPAWEHLHRWAEHPGGQPRQPEEKSGGRPTGLTHTRRRTHTQINFSQYLLLLFRRWLYLFVIQFANNEQQASSTEQSNSSSILNSRA